MNVLALLMAYIEFLIKLTSCCSYGVWVAQDSAFGNQNSPPRADGAQFMITSSPLTSALPCL
ncbi:UNVERIFIED_ORG: hypothetical protein J2Y75_002717 [Pseudomonas silesiensis]